MIERISHFSYGLVGWTARGLAPHLKDMERSLERAGLKIALPAYISFMLFSALLASGLGFILSIILARLMFALPFSLASIILGISVGVLGFGVTFSITYFLPSLTASRKRNEIEANLPFTISFMSILSSAGLPPGRIFRALAVLEERGQVGIGGEAKTILRDLEVFGIDLSTAIKSAAIRSPSRILAGILEGMLAVIHTGGDLAKFFEEEARSLMGMRRATMREFVDTLLMLAEIYMSMFIAFPLILLLLLAIMSFMGGGVIGGMTPEMMIMLIIYVIVPVFGIIYIVMLSLMTPRE
ncbi:TPA: hypothetical protein EYP27_04590 [Candidatus Bathyarchaeota archaeon]|nr:hypothetical protein [Candidatus Bathyarchaeota archaeon]